MALAKQIDEALVQHEAWKTRLAAAIQSGKCDCTMHEVRSDDHCEFGKWLYALPAAISGTPDGVEVTKLHRHFHYEAARVLGLALAGRKEDALAAMNHMSPFSAVSGQLARSMQEAIDETEKRRATQIAFNKKNNITPASIKKSIQDILSSVYEADYVTVPIAKEKQRDYAEPQQIPQLIKQLRKKMKEAAARLDFEEAAELRDRIKVLQEEDLLWK